MSLLLRKSVDTTKLAAEVSPNQDLYSARRKSNYLSFVSHNDMLWLELYQYRQYAISEVIQNPLLRGGGKNTDTYLFTTLSRLARRYLAISATSCPMERLFSAAGKVDAVRWHLCAKHHNSSSLLSLSTPFGTY